MHRINKMYNQQHIYLSQAAHAGFISNIIQHGSDLVAVMRIVLLAVVSKAS